MDNGITKVKIVTDTAKGVLKGYKNTELITLCASPPIIGQSAHGTTMEFAKQVLEAFNNMTVTAVRLVSRVHARPVPL